MPESLPPPESEISDSVPEIPGAIDDAISGEVLSSGESSHSGADFFSLEEEQRLAQEVANNNSGEALAELFIGYKSYLYAIAYNLLRRNPGLSNDMEDYLQTTYEKALAAIDTFTNAEKSGAVRRWFSKILKRTILDEMKSWGVAYTDTVDMRQADELQPLFMHKPVDLAKAAINGMAAHNVTAILNEVLVSSRTDPDRAYKIMRKAFYEQSTPTEIADELGLTLGVVKGVLERARAAVRNRLGDYD